MAEPKIDTKKAEEPVPQLSRAERLKVIGTGQPDPATGGEPSARAVRLKEIGAKR